MDESCPGMHVDGMLTYVDGMCASSSMCSTWDRCFVSEFGRHHGMFDVGLCDRGQHWDNIVSPLLSKVPKKQ
jgi:hypothetical protein